MPKLYFDALYPPAVEGEPIDVEALPTKVLDMKDTKQTHSATGYSYEKNTGYKSNNERMEKLQDTALCHFQSASNAADKNEYRQ